MSRSGKDPGISKRSGSGAERRSAPGPTPQRCAPGRNAEQSLNLEKYPPPPSPPAHCAVGRAQNSATRITRCKVNCPLPGSRSSSRDAFKSTDAWRRQTEKRSDFLRSRSECCAMFEVTFCGAAVFFSFSSTPLPPPPPLPPLLLLLFLVRPPLLSPGGRPTSPLLPPPLTSTTYLAAIIILHDGDSMGIKTQGRDFCFVLFFWLWMNHFSIINPICSCTSKVYKKLPNKLQILCFCKALWSFT